jgi:hypothetical protein
MSKDFRFSTIKVLIEKEHIKTFNDIYNYIPKSNLARELNMNTDRMTQLMEHPEKFTLEKLVKIAGVLDVDFKTILELVYQQLQENKKKIKTKK